MLLCTALLWSVMLNLSLFNHLRLVTLYMQNEFSQREAAAERAKQIDASSQIPEASDADETRQEPSQTE